MDRRPPNARRRWPWVAVALLALLVVFVGPWPMPPDRYPDELWARATFERLQRLPVRAAEAPLRAGVARRDITPPPGVPLAGYGARHPKENTGAREALHVTALTLAAGPLAVTVVGGDLLLTLPKLTTAVREATGLPPEALYFTASHTHSGPGGFDDGLVARTNLGDFHPEYFRHLVTAMADAVRESRRALRPVRLRYSRLRLQGAARDLLHYHLTQAPIHPVIHVLEAFALDGRRLAFLLTSSLHPTLLGKRNRLASGDFPSVLLKELEVDGGLGLYAAGAVGGTTAGAIPEKNADEVSARAALHQRVGRRMAEWVRAGLSGGGPQVALDGRWQAGEATVARVRLQVDLPAPVYHVGEHLRLSPWLVRGLFHPGGETTMDGLRVGPVWMVGIPADFSAELAEDLEVWARRRDGHAWVTGFNGDYVGYLMPRARHATPHYTTRDANLYGPAAGEYFRDLARALMERMAAARP